MSLRPTALPALALAIALAGLPARAAETPPPLADDTAKTLYTLGQLVSRSLASFSLTPAELEQVRAGLEDGVLGRQSRVDLSTYAPRIEALQLERQSAIAARQRESGDRFLAGAAAEAGAARSASGVVTKPLQPGTGAAPKATDRVKVHYEGRLIDGSVFDSSLQRGEPATFRLDEVIPCWTEALQQVKAGGRVRIGCPSSVAYGDDGRPPTIPPGATLVFDVQLLEIVP
jgi:FKBP-type peptidyl-prolyl cis-trans isomerase FkpA